MLLRTPQPPIDAKALRTIRCAVRSAIRSGRIKQQDEDDLVQDAVIHLMKRTEHYDSDRAEWSTFCRVVTQRYLSNVRRRTKRTIQMTSIHQVHKDRHGDDYFPEQVAAPEHSHHNCGKRLRSTTEMVQLKADVDNTIAQLPAGLQPVCQAYLAMPTTNAVAGELSISRATVRRHLDKVRKEIAEQHLEEYR